MKKLLVLIPTLLLVPIVSFAYTSPGKPTGFVNDFAGIFSAEEKNALEIKVGNFERPAGVETAVVTISSLEDETIETYAVKLFEEWGIGDARQDNGLLILIAPKEREVRIEVGYGLEPYVTDADSSRIIRNIIVPAFKNNEYYSGIDEAITEIELLINKDPEALSRRESSGFNISGEFLAVIFFFIVNLIAIMARSKSWWLGGIIGAIIAFILFKTLSALGVGVLIGLLVDFLLSKLSGKIPRGPGGMFLGGMGGFGGGRSGGFGGFGGGMSGGGGSSGRW